MAAYWSEKDYTPFFLMDEPTHNIKEVRSEYTRLRDIARKRVNRLREQGFGDTADYLEKAMPKLSELKTEKAVRQHLARLHALEVKQEFTVRGVKDIWSNLKKNVDPNIPLNEALGLHEFMKSWRTSAYRWLISTNDVEEMYEEYKEAGGKGSFENFYKLYKMPQKG